MAKAKTLADANHALFRSYIFYCAVPTRRALSVGLVPVVESTRRRTGSPPRPDIRLPLHSYRPLFFVLIGETVLLLFCAWAVHFKVGLAVGRAHLNEMEFFALVVFVGLFYLWRKGCADERG